MTHFLITMAASFFGTIAALIFWTIYNSAASPGPLIAPAERTRSSKHVTLGAAVAFAVVSCLIFYFISAGLMSAGLGAVAAVVAFIILAYIARTLR
jgi:hypothetical protein